MSPELVNILAQIPIVAAFIWYSERLYNKFEKFLREERASREASLEKISIQLEQIDDNLTAHRSEFINAVAIMKDRTERPPHK